jgi:5'-deoxynucleotidase YfbR-like HD superfamily hydrolase
MNKKAEKNGWIVTSTGKKIWPLEPRFQDIDIVDIAHHLSNICRFTGAVREFYSVAQHSVLTSTLLKEHALFGLLHDASEAYLCDVAHPVKHDPEFEFYRQAEERLQGMILRKFGVLPMLGVVSAKNPPEVDEIDMFMAVLEGLSLMPRHEDAMWTELEYMFEDWGKVGIIPWSPKEAERRFMDRFEELYKEKP